MNLSAQFHAEAGRWVLRTLLFPPQPSDGGSCAMDHDPRNGGLPGDDLPARQGSKNALCLESEAEVEDGARAFDRPGCVAGS